MSPDRTTPTCAYRVDPGLIEALDQHLGPPLDSYVRGWQVWLEDDGPDGARLEWRLHPPSGFRMPRGVNPHDLFDVVIQALADVADPATDSLDIGGTPLTLAQVWEVLEVFPADGDPLETSQVVSAAARRLDRAPEVAGRIDHGRLGDEWKGARGRLSIAAALFAALEPVAAPQGPGEDR